MEGVPERPLAWMQSQSWVAMGAATPACTPMEGVPERHMPRSAVPAALLLRTPAALATTPTTTPEQIQMLRALEASAAPESIQTPASAHAAQGMEQQALQGRCAAPRPRSMQSTSDHSLLLHRCILPNKAICGAQCQSSSVVEATPISVMQIDGLESICSIGLRGRSCSRHLCTSCDRPLQYGYVWVQAAGSAAHKRGATALYPSTASTGGRLGPWQSSCFCY